MQGTYLDTILPRADLPENQAAMPEIGQRVRLSRGDILQTTALYQCPACGKTYQVPCREIGKYFTTSLVHLDVEDFSVKLLRCLVASKAPY